MPKYKYVAVNINKVKFSGSFVADNEKDLAVQLAKQNLFLVSCTQVKRTSPSVFFSVSGKVKLNEITTFCRQFSIMINAGISVVNSMGILKNQGYTAYFKSILDIVYDDIKGGLSMSEAMKKHEKVFPGFFRSMVYVGEISGQLDRVLLSLADYYEKDREIKKKAKSALIYPGILLALTVGIIVIMLVYVIPTFRTALANMKVEMPAITAAIYGMSDWLLSNWKLIMLGFFLFFFLIISFKKTKKGRYFFDTLKLKIPIYRKVQINLITSKFARGYSLLLSSGMDVVDAMDTMAVVLGNANVEKRFKKAVEDVRLGNSITTSLGSYKLFPDILLQMVAIGEKTGTLSDVLSRSCLYFDDQVDSSLTTLTSMLQPILIAILGGSVGTMFYAIYAPMISIMQTYL
ncbi:MAG: type II secretion system F family protein [Eubacteriales bacterium]|nr:type II secretion system F family protein [Eubacteriales bacterium]